MPLILNQFDELTKIMETYETYEFYYHIPINSKIGIYGKNSLGISLFKVIKDKRPDVSVVFFVDTFNCDTCFGTETILVDRLASRINDIDFVLFTHIDKVGQMSDFFKYLPVEKTKISLISYIQYFNGYEPIEIEDFDRKISVIRSRLSEKSRRAWDAIIKSIKLMSVAPIYSHKKSNGIPLDYLKEVKTLDGCTVIDGGAFDGENSLTFLNKVGENGKVFAFEPLGSDYFLDAFKEALSHDPRIIHVNSGLWSHSTRMPFTMDTQASKITKDQPFEGGQSIQVQSLDQFVSENKIKRVDFLKMDIEGAEIEALKGAQKTIERDTPDLAITIYHGLDQFVEVPYYIMTKHQNYIYNIDIHNVIGFDTVLYGTPKPREPL